MSDCAHKDLEIKIEHAQWDSEGVNMIVIKARCRGCQEPVTFLGLPVGKSLGRPTTSPDSHTAFLPITVARKH